MARSRHFTKKEGTMDTEKLKEAREELRAAFDKYEGALETALATTAKGSDEEEDVLASLTQVESARRVVWMD
jgi:hypothetical protein